MVIEKENAIGIDAVIKKLQKTLTKLPWADLITIYPKCYNVLREDRRYIEHYSGNGDYENVTTAEGNKCFFVVDDEFENVGNGVYSVGLEIFFTLDLSEIKNNTGRQDSEVHLDVLKLINSANVNMSIDGFTTGIESVFNGYTFKITSDMQPYHCFKINLTINSFKLNEKCCC